MKHRTYALLLAATLSVSLLAGCGSSNGANSSQSSDNSSISSSQGSQSSSGSDVSTPDASGSGSDVSTSASGSTSTPDGSQGETQEQAKLTLSRTGFTLFSAGSSYTLKVDGVAEDTKVTFKSGNPDVATVDENGKVVAVKPGNTKITVTAGDQTATCVVACKWEESKPSTGGGSSSGSGSSSSGGGTTTPDPEPSKVDLAAFYSSVTSKYSMPNLSLADSTMLDNYYAGLSSVATEQSQVYINMMSMNMGEISLVQVKDSKDVATVKAIFQARIDSMVNGGAWYPEPTRIWSEQSRVVSNGNYVMMVVGEDCDAIVKDFNALF